MKREEMNAWGEGKRNWLHTRRERWRSEVQKEVRDRKSLAIVKMKMDEGSNSNDVKYRGRRTGWDTLVWMGTDGRVK